MPSQVSPRLGLEVAEGAKKVQVFVEGFSSLDQFWIGFADLRFLTVDPNFVRFVLAHGMSLDPEAELFFLLLEDSGTKSFRVQNVNI